MILHSNPMFISPSVTLCFQKALWCAWWNQFFFSFHPFFCLWSLKILQFFFKWWILFLKMGRKKIILHSNPMFISPYKPLFTKNTLIFMMKSVFFSFQISFNPFFSWVFSMPLFYTANILHFYWRYFYPKDLQWL